MQETLGFALSGHKKTMIRLYDDNKRTVFCLCELLTDREQAELISAEVMEEAWDMLPKSNVKTEKQFSRFVLILAAKKCRNKLFGASVKQFKVANAEKPDLPELKDEPFDGDIQKGISEMKTVLAGLDAPCRFVWLLRMFGLSNGEISRIISQRESVSEYFYGTACRELERMLLCDGRELNIRQAAAVLSAKTAETVVPESVDAACYLSVKAHSRLVIKDKKRFLITAVSLLLALCIVGAGTAFVKSGFFTPSEDDFEASDSAETAAYTPPELDGALTYYADIEIEGKGTVTVKLDQGAAPITAANFVALAKDGFYDGLTFHRIIDGFMMQGGDPEGTGLGGSDNTIVGEFSENGHENTLSHTRGALSMARSSAYDSASSQFFIVQEDSTYLDGEYAVFGYVTAGMDIVDAVCEEAEPTDDNGTIEKSAQPVIKSVTVRTE